jgi:hypothetical protein
VAFIGSVRWAHSRHGALHEQVPSELEVAFEAAPDRAYGQFLSACQSSGEHRDA